MKEKGLMIDREGNIYPFGIHGGSESLDSGHKISFESDVVNKYFQELGIQYDKDETVYSNAEKLSREGNIVIFNQTLNNFTSTQILAYMPINPTRKQIQVLREKEQELDKMERKAIHELNLVSNKYSDAIDYDSILDYINKKTHLQENGDVIFEDGTILSFGNYVCPDEDEYPLSSTHTQSFMNEILPSFEFRASNYIYKDDDNIYLNGIRFSQEGLVMIFNNQKSRMKESEILVYLPMNPTDYQLETLKLQKNILRTEVQSVYTFLSYDLDDYIEYESLEEYIKEKQEEKHK